MKYALGRWEALTRYAEDGHLEIDNNAAERALRAVALGRLRSTWRIESLAATGSLKRTKQYQAEHPPKRKRRQQQKSRIT